jgi:hypothetical protein
MDTEPHKMYTRLAVTAGFALALLATGTAGAGEEGPASGRPAAVVVPFYGIGGKLESGPADRLTRRVVMCLRRSGGLSRVSAGYSKSRQDERIRVRPYRVRIGSRCWVVVEVGHGQNPAMTAVKSAPIGCGFRTVDKVLRDLMPAVAALTRAVLKNSRPQAPAVTVTPFHPECEEFATEEAGLGVANLLAVRLAALVPVVPHRWLEPEQAPRPGPRKILKVEYPADMSAEERRNFAVRRDLARAKNLGVSRLIVPALVPGTGGCKLVAEIVSVRTGKTTAVGRSGPIASAENLPAALELVAVKVGSALDQN